MPGFRAKNSVGYYRTPVRVCMCVCVCGMHWQWELGAMVLDTVEVLVRVMEMRVLYTHKTKGQQTFCGTKMKPTWQV